MSVARNTFLSRIDALSAAVSNPAIVAPSLSAANSAQLFRNGLAVISFSILEDFLRTRVEEIFSAISASPIPFSTLPPALREMLTVGAVRGLKQQIEHAKREGTDSVALAQSHARCIASTASAAHTFSAFGFGREHSNVAWEEIESLLAALFIDNSGQTLGSVALRIASGTFAAKSFFNELAKSRHKAAHDASSAVQAMDLQSYPINLSNFAVVFDAVVSAASVKIKTADTKYLAGEKLSGKSVLVRIIEESSNGKQWREIVPSNPPAKHAKKVSSSESDAVLAAMPRATKNAETLIVRDRQGALKAWHTPAL